MTDRLLKLPKPHCFHQAECPVVIEAIFRQDSETLKVVREWGDERCPHTTHWGTEDRPYFLKRQCDKCWGVLKEIE